MSSEKPFLFQRAFRYIWKEEKEFCTRIRKKMEEFQQVIGYQFQNKNLLRQALTHSSYANEKHMHRLSDNERLEFLGDAVLEIISSEYLFNTYPDKSEGDLTKLRASIVCEPTLALCTKEMDLGKYLYLGKRRGYDRRKKS